MTKIEVLWKGKLAVQVTGWQAAPNGDPGKATTVVRVNGRRHVAYAKDIRTK